MAWEPESFTSAQRRAASKAIVRAQVLLDSLDRQEFGAHNTEAVRRAYSRVDDLLAMLYDDLYGLDASNPQWPNAS
jgi:hypothetical protein